MSVSFAVYRLLPNASRLLRLTCRGLHALPARLSLHSLSSRARHWLEVTQHHVLDLDDFINELHLSNLHNSCDYWKLLQHRVSSTTGHQQSLNGRRMAQFSAPLRLWHSLFCCGGFYQSCGKIRLDHLVPQMIPVLCLLLRSSQRNAHAIDFIFSHPQSWQLAMLPARSELSTILPFELRAVSPVFMLLKH